MRDAAFAAKGRTPSPELAFAYGYMLHAAMDTWAHSYVNAYSGDIFSSDRFTGRCSAMKAGW